MMPRDDARGVPAGIAPRMAGRLLEWSSAACVYRTRVTSQMTSTTRMTTTMARSMVIAAPCVGMENATRRGVWVALGFGVPVQASLE